MRKIIKRKKKKPNAFDRLENQIAHLTAQVTQLGEMVVKQNYRIEEIKFQRPPIEDIRVAHTKAIPEPKSDFEKLVNWTSDQINNHLDSLSGEDLQDIIQFAITGEPIPGEVKHHPKGTQGKMTDWLNANVPTVNTQENVWKSIEEAKVIAKHRNAVRQANAIEFTKEWTAAMKESKALQEAYRLADIDTVKVDREGKEFIQHI